MFTIATLPKPFIGHIGLIQRNAVGSWLQMDPRPQVILFGAEEGTAAVAREFGVQHIPELRCNALGTPFLPDVFAKAEAAAIHPYLCYSNCDIILFPEFAEAFRRIQRFFEQFLLVGECANLDVRTPLDFGTGWAERLRRGMAEHWKRRGINADFFLFAKGMFPSFPPLILGRPFFDNWILYETRRLHVPVVDITPVHRAIHQNHFYAHVPGETLQTHKGEEAHENLRLIGGYDHVYWVTDATHRLTGRGIRRNLAGTFLLKQRSLRFLRALKRIKSRLLG